MNLTNQTGLVFEGESIGPEPEALTGIYRESVNMAIWERTPAQAMLDYVAALISGGRKVSLRCSGDLDTLMTAVQAGCPRLMPTARRWAARGLSRWARPRP